MCPRTLSSETSASVSTLRGVLPVAVLSAHAPGDTRKRYIDSPELEQWISRYVEKNRDKLPRDITALRVYQRVKDILTQSVWYTFP